jgi:hypothetical protein
VHRLLARYNLDMEQVAAAADSKTKAEATGHVRESIDNWRWCVSIHHAVAKLHFCHMFRTPRGHKADLTWIGKSTNVAIAKDMSYWLIESVWAEVRAQQKAQGRKDSAFFTGFTNGASDRICSRCWKMLADAEAAQATDSESEPGTALVLASVYEMAEKDQQDYLANVLKVHLGTGTRRPSPKDSHAYGQGATYGDRVKLTKEKALTQQRQLS